MRMRERLLAGVAAVALALAPVAAMAQGFTLPDGSVSQGKLISVPALGKTPPVLTACGTTPAIVGDDKQGIITLGTTATGCVITFAAPYTAVPNCLVVWQGTPLAAQNWTTTAAAITLVQTSTTNNKVNYFCLGQTGG